MDLRPRYVLIEGPSDVNDWIDELYLGHRLPVAVFSYVRDSEAGEGMGISSWTPFCDYSPEWVALQTAREVGAQALFMDLPAWNRAFSGIKNRYADRRDRYGARMAALCRRFHVSDSDSLWDSLFEGPLEPAELSSRLALYFEELRAGDCGDAPTQAREAYMASYMAWAAGQCSNERDRVVVVCGGYHAPALSEQWKTLGTVSIRPDKTLSSGVQGQSYLVPYSFKRLDAFVGYEAGMPSPGYYQRVWEEGAEHASESMLFQVLARLRQKRQTVSTADGVAASAAMHALMQMRGHGVPLRVDVLDALAQALVKNALEVPLPWEQRGVLLPRTDPLLVDIVATFSGEQIGELSPRTRHPPLVADAMQRLAAKGISYMPSAIALEFKLGDAEDLEKSRLLHGLRILGIPGFQWQHRPAGERNIPHTASLENWVLKRDLDAEAALIEAAVYGATVPQAAAARLEALFLAAGNVGDISSLYLEVLRVGSKALGARLLDYLRSAISAELSLSAVGVSLSHFLLLLSQHAQVYCVNREELFSLMLACFDRALWLFEGLSGRRTKLGKGELLAIAACKEMLYLTGDVHVDELRREHAKHLFARRARDADAPAMVRGAALGCLWSVFESEMETEKTGTSAEQEAVAAMRAAALPETLGDFLAGLFALAREPLQRSKALIAAADAVFAEMSEQDFLIAVPALRMAFSYFPPRERLIIAERVLELRGAVGISSHALLSSAEQAHMLLLGRRLENQTSEIIGRFGLGSSEEVHERAEES